MRLKASQCRWLVISYTSDWLFPPAQSREIVVSLIAENKAVSYCDVESRNGHDAFLLPNELATYGELARAFVANLNRQDQTGSQLTATTDEPSNPPGHSPKSIFHAHHRLDYDMIVELIPPDASVLDLGCGSGGLLSRLAQRQEWCLMGIELEERAVVSCVQRGLDVVQHDVNQGLSAFADVQFDFVVLSQTLQTVMDVERVVDETPRVGKRGASSVFRIWVISNFGAVGSTRQVASRRCLAGLSMVQYTQPAVLDDRRLRRVLSRQTIADPSAHRSTPKPIVKSPETRTSTRTWQS